MSNTLTKPSVITRYALERAGQLRSYPFTRVSREFRERVEANTRAFIDREIQRHPSVGRTLK